MPSFALDLPSTASEGVPVEDIKAKDTERLFIDMDGSQISPFMTTEPGWGPPSQHQPSGGIGPHGSRKFLRLDDKNMFIYIADSQKPERDPSADLTTPLTGGDAADTTEDSIPLESLEMLGPLGSGAQGSVRACRYQGVEYAIKTIPVGDALDRSQADVERQARKAAIVRELKMVARKKRVRCDHVVAVYNAYFQRKDLLILMERMSLSLEDVQKMLEPLSWEAVKRIAQKAFGDHFSGGPKATATPPSHGPVGLVSFQDASKSPAVRGHSAGSQTPKQTIAFSAAGAARRSPLPEVAISLIAKDALMGLCNFHEDLRVVHTDLKPSNLMFSQSKQLVKLADFGCNMELNAAGVVPHDSGVALGTKMYMSPERWAEVGTGFDAGTDVWSLGITLMELANGCHPCEHFKENFWSFQDQLRLDRMIRPQHCSQQCYDFLSKCLIRDAAKRPTARDLLSHEFVVKYNAVPRSKLANFLVALERESRESHKKQLQQEIERLVADRVRDPLVNDRKNKNVKLWKGFTGLNRPTPSIEDFPALA